MSERERPTALRAAGFLDKPSRQLNRQLLPNPPPAQDSLFCCHGGKGQGRNTYVPPSPNKAVKNNTWCSASIHNLSGQKNWNPLTWPLQGRHSVLKNHHKAEPRRATTISQCLPLPEFLGNSLYPTDVFLPALHSQDSISSFSNSNRIPRRMGIHETHRNVFVEMDGVVVNVIADEEVIGYSQEGHFRQREDVHELLYSWALKQERENIRVIFFVRAAALSQS